MVINNFPEENPPNDVLRRKWRQLKLCAVAEPKPLSGIRAVVIAN